MALTARDYYSVEVAQSENGASVAPLAPNQLHGRVRMARFSFVSPVGDTAVGKNVILCRLPKGARILSGKIVSDTSGGKVSVGLSGANGNALIDDTAGATVADAPAFLAAAATDISGTVMQSFGITVALGYGYVLKKDCFLTMTVDTAALTAAKTVQGHVEYVID